MEDSNLKVTLRRIDEYIAEQQEHIKRGKELEQLRTNPAFLSVFVDGYINTEAEKLFNILVDPTGVSPYSDEEIRLKLASISDFKRYINNVEISAEQAQNKIAREELERVRVTATGTGE